MLNYIWLGLIVVAILVALGKDSSELSNDRFRNGKPIPAYVDSADYKVIGPNHYLSKYYFLKRDLVRFYGNDEVKDIGKDTLGFPADIVTSQAAPTHATVTLSLGDSPPKIFNDISSNSGDATKLVGTSTIPPQFQHGSPVMFTPPEVYFRVMNKVTNDGILKTVDVAVTIALGLIGVMTLWLGVMRIAEAAGLVGMLAKLVRPIMIRLFPEVPPDHPAMGAMVMNMTANFLGLSNAATPLGLKAMEELNKLNPVAGTATNAMCMFLTINTTALTLVPATVIAIRLTLGSAEPSDIIMPTFLATLFSLIIGVAFTRFIERFFPVPKQNVAPPTIQNA